MENYLGSKGASGLYQAIINLMPPHDTYIEPFLGAGGILRRKAPAQRTLVNDLNPACIDHCHDLNVETFSQDAQEFLQTIDFSSTGRTLIYCDPTYVHETRTSNNRYAHEMTDDDHQRLLALLLSLDCYVMISGYRHPIYDVLDDWYSIDVQAMTRGGVRTETIWCNFEPSEMHYHRYAGKNFTDRQRIQRKAERWASRYAAMPPGERQAVLAALLAVKVD